MSGRFEITSQATRHGLRHTVHVQSRSGGGLPLFTTGELLDAKDVEALIEEALGKFHG